MSFELFWLPPFLPEPVVSVTQSVAQPVAAAVPPKKRESKSAARRRFYRSQEWQEARELCLETMGRICVKCGATERINVDHILPRSKHPELSLAQSNLRPLCWPCNRAKAAKIEQVD